MGFTMTAAEIIKFLETHGFIQTRGGRHQMMMKGGLRIPVPGHTGEIPKGTVQAILKKAGFTADDVLKWRE